MGNFSKFSTFSRFASFYEGPIWLWRANVVIITDEIVFSQNQIFNKKWNSYVNFFLVLCFTPFVVDVTVLPYWCLKFTFSRILTNCLICLAESADISKRANIFSKFLFINFTKLIFKVTLCQVCFKWNKYSTS